MRGSGETGRRSLWRIGSVAACSLIALALAGCGSAPGPASSSKRSGSKEYFAESVYGVKASPRVTNQRTRLPRGGGRDQLGKPYKVKGRWFKPREEPGYLKTGAASWYGDAFHGRLTANGEIYDMTHLTAAHPTMPLPSYARVTNLANNSSVIVRVNDRGPFERGRLIDLSRRAAEMLDYQHAGVAQVQVEYLGRAPLHGRDDAFLMASYRPGKTGPARLSDPNDGLPTGVMIAMDGPNPTRQRRPSAFPSAPVQRDSIQLASIPSAPPVPQAFDVARIEAVLAAAPGPSASGDLILPDFGPIVPERPVQVASGYMSYADQRVSAASEAFMSFDRMGSASIAAAWKRSHGTSPASASPFVAAATLDDRAQAQSLAARLNPYGSVRIAWDGDVFSVELRPNAGNDIDGALAAAWANGAPDAMIVRE